MTKGQIFKEANAYRKWSIKNVVARAKGVNLYVYP